MDKAQIDSFPKLIRRRTHALKVTTSLLNHELELAKEDQEVIIDRGLLQSILSTLEMFVEDCEDVLARVEGAPASTAPTAVGGTPQPEKRFEIPKTQPGRIH